MSRIILEGMEFYAYHGCFKEEQLTGNRFLVDLEIEVDTSKAELSDQLKDTVNYQAVYRQVSIAMKDKSQLLEHLSRRILDNIESEFPAIWYIKLKVSKMNPPMGGQMKCVSLETERRTVKG